MLGIWGAFGPIMSAPYLRVMRFAVCWPEVIISLGQVKDEQQLLRADQGPGGRGYSPGVFLLPLPPSLGSSRGPVWTTWQARDAVLPRSECWDSSVLVSGWRFKAAPGT